MNDLHLDRSTGVRPDERHRLDGRGQLDIGHELPLLTQYLRIALRRKWVIMGAVAGAVLLGLLVTLLMTPRFTATSTLEISRESDNIVKVEGVERESNPADLEFYQTQYGLLRSRSLAERVVRELRLADDPSFFAMFRVPVEEEARSLGGKQVFAATGRDKRVRDASTALLDNLTIIPIRASRLVEVSFESPDAAFSAKIINAWSKNFIELNLERRFDATSYARKFLENRLEQLRGRLEESERMLVSYAASQKIITIPVAGANAGSSIERPIVADDLAALNTALADATNERMLAHSRVGREGGTAKEALSNQAISSLREKRAEIAADYAKMMAQFEPDYPPAKALASQLAQLDRSLGGEESRVSDSLRRTYAESMLRERSLQDKVESLKVGLLDQKRRSIQYNIFQRDVDTNRQLYDGLLQRYKEIGVAGGVGTNNISIVDRAEIPEKPSSPRLLINLFISLLAGLIIGAIATFALEQIDEAIADPSEVERELRFPLLGVIPQSGDIDPREALEDRKSPVVEAFLSVQTNLEFATENGAPRSMSVTSTRPAEGKSTTAYALARSLARAQRKVVLIDADMRSPSIHGHFDLPNDKGLSNYLSGGGDIAGILAPGPIAGLSVMTAGPQPPNAAELLTGPRLQLLIAELLKTFDHVVIDSPPVMGLADAPLIASKVQGTIYVLESHGVRASLAKVALSRLVAAHAQVLGVVLTKFEEKRAHFGYGYDYGYGYGLGDKSSEKAG